MGKDVFNVFSKEIKTPNPLAGEPVQVKSLGKDKPMLLRRLAAQQHCEYSTGEKFGNGQTNVVEAAAAARRPGGEMQY